MRMTPLEAKGEDLKKHMMTQNDIAARTDRGSQEKSKIILGREPARALAEDASPQQTREKQAVYATSCNAGHPAEPLCFEKIVEDSGPLGSS